MRTTRTCGTPPSRSGTPSIRRAWPGSGRGVCPCGRNSPAAGLLILTNVQAVYRAYGTPHQEAIRRLTLAQADHLLAGKELGTGSMRPKVEAAADFVRVRGATEGARAIIAELSQGLAALRGDAGTTISAAPS